jgi:nitrogen fixation/metabolism regulation signal transduction histidine kinase
LYSFSFQLIIITTATIALALFASHKIAGPLFRLERISEQIARGEFPKEVRIRAKDQVKSFANSMDNLVKEMKKKIEIVISSIENIRKRRQKMDVLFSEKKLDLFKKEFNIIKKEINAIEETLESFKTK